MRKKVIGVLMATLIGAAVGAALGYGPLLSFKSEGVLRMALTAEEFKRITQLATSPTVTKRYMATFPPPGVSRERVGKLIKSIAKENWVVPVPKVTKAEADQLPDLLLQLQQQYDAVIERRRNGEESVNDFENPYAVYLGVDVSYSGPNAKLASDVTTWLGSYFKDMAMLSAMRDLVSNWVAQTQTFTNRAAERKQQYEFDIRQAQARADAFKKIVATYPDAAHVAMSQIVGVRKGNEKFMSPMAQLIGAESDVIDLQGKLQLLARETDQQVLVNAVIHPVMDAVANSSDGRDSVTKVAEILQKMSVKAQTPAQQAKLVELVAGVSSISTRFGSQPHFLAQPIEADVPERPRPLMVIALAALFAAVLSAIILWRESVIGVLLSGRDEQR